MGWIALDHNGDMLTWTVYHDKPIWAMYFCFVHSSRSSLLKIFWEDTTARSSQDVELPAVYKLQFLCHEKLLEHTGALLELSTGSETMVLLHVHLGSWNQMWNIVQSENGIMSHRNHTSGLYFAVFSEILKSLKWFKCRLPYLDLNHFKPPYLFHMSLMLLASNTHDPVLNSMGSSYPPWFLLVAAFDGHHFLPKAASCLPCCPFWLRLQLRWTWRSELRSFSASNWRSTYIFLFLQSYVFAALFFLALLLCFLSLVLLLPFSCSFASFSCYFALLSLVCILNETLNETLKNP